MPDIEEALEETIRYLSKRNQELESIIVNDQQHYKDSVRTISEENQILNIRLKELLEESTLDLTYAYQSYKREIEALSKDTLTLAEDNHRLREQVMLLTESQESSIKGIKEKYDVLRKEEQDQNTEVIVVLKEELKLEYEEILKDQTKTYQRQYKDQEAAAANIKIFRDDKERKLTSKLAQLEQSLKDKDKSTEAVVSEKEKLLKSLKTQEDKLKIALKEQAEELESLKSKLQDAYKAIESNVKESSDEGISLGEVLHSDKIGKLQLDNRSMFEKNQALEKEMRQLEPQILELRRQLKIQVEGEGLVKQNVQLRNVSEVLRKQLDEIQANQSRLEKENKALKEKDTKSQESIHAIQSEIEESKKSLKLKEAQILEVERAKESKLKEVQASAKAQNVEIEELKSERAKLVEMQAAHALALKSLEDNARGKDEELKVVEARNGVLEEEKRAIQLELEKFKAQIAEVRSERDNALEKATTEKQALQEALDQLQRSLDSEQAKLVEMQAAHALELKNFEAHAREKAEELRAVQARNGELELVAQKKDDAILYLEGLQKEKEREIARLRDEYRKGLAVLGTENETLQNLLGSANSQIESLKKSLAKRDQDLDRFGMSNEDLLSQNLSLSTRLKELESKAKLDEEVSVDKDARIAIFEAELKRIHDENLKRKSSSIGIQTDSIDSNIEKKESKDHVSVANNNDVLTILRNLQNQQHIKLSPDYSQFKNTEYKQGISPSYEELGSFSDYIQKNTINKFVFDDDNSRLQLDLYSNARDSLKDKIQDIKRDSNTSTDISMDIKDQKFTMKEEILTKNGITYRNIDLPMNSLCNNGFTLMLSLKDKDGNDRDSLSMTVSYDTSGKLVEVTHPQPISFDENGIGYFEIDKTKYTIPVNKEKYDEMIQAMQDNKGRACNIPQIIQEQKDKIKSLHHHLISNSKTTESLNLKISGLPKIHQKPRSKSF